jgi:hypothetical protein
MSLTEVHEAEAPEETAAIYAELRRALGVPLVNLIWRHFAALPGVLPWAWATVRPVAGAVDLRDGVARMGHCVARIAGSGLRDLPVLAPDQLAVVAVYNRGNCSNLQLLTALRRAVAGETVGHGAPLPGAAALAPLPAVPPMPRMEALDPGTVQQVRALAALHGEEGAAAIPSLYRHLALWPALLPRLHAVLAEAAASGLIEQGRRTLIAEAEATASRLLPALRPPADFPAEHRDAVLKALEAFTGRLIAEMSVVGLMLQQGTENQTRAAASWQEHEAQLPRQPAQRG